MRSKIEEKKANKFCCMIESNQAKIKRLHLSLVYYKNGIDYLFIYSFFIQKMVSSSFYNELLNRTLKRIRSDSSRIEKKI